METTPDGHHPTPNQPNRDEWAKYGFTPEVLKRSDAEMEAIIAWIQETIRSLRELGEEIKAGDRDTQAMAQRIELLLRAKPKL